MVLVISGKDIEGNPAEFYLDGFLKEALDLAKYRVYKKNFDYVALVCGVCGSGKSTMIRSVAKFCDENFSHKNICFSAEEFISLSNSLPEYSAIVLDESFSDLSTSVTRSKQFQRIVNHLQLIRQKKLFIFLLLPNFFDLSKGIAIFRSNHLFVVYSNDEGDRGYFNAYDKTNKRLLYIKGSKFINYHAQKPNFFGRYTLEKKIIDINDYELAKKNHLLSQDLILKEKNTKDDFKELICELVERKIQTIQQLSIITKKSERTIQRYIQNYPNKRMLFVNPTNE